LANSPVDAPAPAQGDLITDHLLEFRSIRGLQEQNQKLLKMTRGLMAKLDAQEINRATSDSDDLDTAATLEQATQIINRLHAQLLEAQKKINEATKERDFFSKLLAKGEGLRWSPSSGANGSGSNGDGDAPHQQTIVSLQAEMDSIRSKAEKEINEIRDQLRTRSEAAGVAEVEKAKAEAKATLLEGEYPMHSSHLKYRGLKLMVEQHRILNDASSLQKQEYSNLDQQYRQVQGALNQAQNERKSVRIPICGIQPMLITRQWSKLQANKLKSTDYALILPTSELRRSSGRLVQIFLVWHCNVGDADQAEQRVQTPDRFPSRSDRAG
jgi:nucleoprotein TPR